MTAPAILPLVADRRRMDRRRLSAEQTVSVRQALIEVARFLRLNRQHDAADMLVDSFDALVKRTTRGGA